MSVNSLSQRNILGKRETFDSTVSPGGVVCILAHIQPLSESLKASKPHQPSSYHVWMFLILFTRMPTHQYLFL